MLKLLNKTAKKIFSIAAFFAFIAVSYTAFALPITVVGRPTYPTGGIAVNAGQSTSLTYTIRNNLNPKITLAPSLDTNSKFTYASAGSVSPITSGTCAAGVSGGNTCTIILSYTAPTNVPTPNPVLATIQFQAKAGGREGEIPAEHGTFNISSGITVLASPTYPQTVTVSTTVNVTYTIHSTVFVSVTPQLISGSTTVSAGSITQTGGTCSSGVTSGNNCTIQLTYTAPATVPSPNPATASIVFGYTGGSNTAAQTGTFNIVEPPSITLLSVITGSVNGGQSVTITGQNLTALLLKSKGIKEPNAPLSKLGVNPTVTFDGQAASIVGTPTSTQIMVTTPSDTANYLAPSSTPSGSQTVQPGASSGSAGGSGRAVNVVVTTTAGSATDTNGYTYVGLGDNYDDGIIYYLNSSDAGGKVVNKSDGSATLWAGANSYCTGLGLNWGLPDPYFNSLNGGPSNNGYVTGDFYLLCNNGSTPSNCTNAYAGMSQYYWGLTDTTVNPNGSYAWYAYFSLGYADSYTKTSAFSYGRCVQAFSE